MYVLKKKSIGLDISDRTIEIAELSDEGDKKKIASIGRVALPTGVVERGRIKDAVPLKAEINKVFAEAKPHPITDRKVIFGLPESQVYTHIFELPPHEKENQDALVLKEAQTSIPLREDDILSSYSVLWEEEGKVEILLVAISKDVFLEWRNFFQSIKIEVLQYDSEMLATFRGLFVKRPERPVCVADIGARTTCIAIFTNKGLRYSYTLDVGGELMTEDIARSLHIPQAEAEELKIKIGLSDKKERIFFILIKILEPIIESVRASFSYFKERTGEDVSGMFLVGGSSKLKGIVKYFTDELNISAWLGESVLLRNIASLEYIEAIGLALRGLDTSWGKTDPVFYVKPPASAHLSHLKKQKSQGDEEKPQKEEIVLATPPELEQIRKLRFEKKLLVAVLLLGVGLVFVAGWYRDYRREKFFKEMRGEKQVVYIQSFELKIPIAVKSEFYSEDRVRARIVEEARDGVTDVDLEREQSQGRVEGSSAAGEMVWGTPVREEVQEGEGGKMSVTFGWLVYTDTDVHRLFTKEVDKVYTEKTAYTINAIEKVTVEPDRNEPFLFYLVGKVSVSAKELVR